jgi:hypothetical protein
MKIRPEEAELFHADRRTDGWTDRQTDMTKLIVAFHSFAGAPNNIKIEFWIIVFKSLLFTSFFCFILLLVPDIGGSKIKYC